MKAIDHGVRKAIIAAHQYENGNKNISETIWSIIIEVFRFFQVLLRQCLYLCSSSKQRIFSNSAPKHSQSTYSVRSVGSEMQLRLSHCSLTMGWTSLDVHSKKDWHLSWVFFYLWIVFLTIERCTPNSMKIDSWLLTEWCAAALPL